MPIIRAIKTHKTVKAAGGTDRIMAITERAIPALPIRFLPRRTEIIPVVNPTTGDIIKTRNKIKETPLKKYNKGHDTLIINAIHAKPICGFCCEASSKSALVSIDFSFIWVPDLREGSFGKPNRAVRMGHICPVLAKGFFYWPS